MLQVRFLYQGSFHTMSEDVEDLLCDGRMKGS